MKLEIENVGGHSLLGAVAVELRTIEFHLSKVHPSVDLMEEVEKVKRNLPVMTVKLFIKE